jgi:hypothetical protein
VEAACSPASLVHLISICSAMQPHSATTAHQTPVFDITSCAPCGTSKVHNPHQSVLQTGISPQRFSNHSLEPCSVPAVYLTSIAVAPHCHSVHAYLHKCANNSCRHLHTTVLTLSNNRQNKPAKPLTCFLPCCTFPASHPSHAEVLFPCKPWQHLAATSRLW